MTPTSSSASGIYGDAYFGVVAPFCGNCCWVILYSVLALPGDCTISIRCFCSAHHLCYHQSHKWAAPCPTLYPEWGTLIGLAYPSLPTVPPLSGAFLLSMSPIPLFHHTALQLRSTTGRTHSQPGVTILTRSRYFLATAPAGGSTYLALKRKLGELQGNGGSMSGGRSH